jgi:hypothetical protein
MVGSLNIAPKDSISVTAAGVACLGRESSAYEVAHHGVAQICRVGLAVCSMMSASARSCSLMSISATVI